MSGKPRAQIIGGMLFAFIISSIVIGIASIWGIGETKTTHYDPGKSPIELTLYQKEYINRLDRLIYIAEQYYKK